LEDPVLRIIRIALFVLVPTVALGVSLAACSDDTTGQTTQDMAVSGGGHDLAMPTHDLANPHD
jgi:hypothetical protein